MIFLDLDIGDKFLILKDTTLFPNSKINILIKISDQPWLVKLPSSNGYSKHHAEFNALAENFPSIGFYIKPETEVLLIK